MSSPGAKPTGEGAMEAFPSPVIGHFLLPEGSVGAIVTNIGVQRRKGRSVEGVGRLLGLQIGLEGGTRALTGHGSLGQLEEEETELEE